MDRLSYRPVRTEPMNPLASLQAEAENCRNCGLAASRTRVVFGDGNPDADILFVGEAPGLNEDLRGVPFVGAAGKLLSESLGRIGLTRGDVYIANIVKCRPPENRNPKSEEIESCRPYLLRQIGIIHPRVVCTLGNFAARTLLDKKVAIMKIRGRPFQVENFFVFPMLHPAAALHQGNLRRAVEEDFQNLRAFLRKNLRPESRPDRARLL
jgi:uracil-DNA glycosylase family 4